MKIIFNDDNDVMIIDGTIADAPVKGDFIDIYGCGYEVISRSIDYTKNEIFISIYNDPYII